MIATQIGAILRKAGYTQSNYAPGQRLGVRQTEGYTVRKVWDTVRVTYTAEWMQHRLYPEAARQTETEALASYRQAIEAAGYVVETVDTGWTQYLVVKERDE